MNEITKDRIQQITTLHTEVLEAVRHSLIKAIQIGDLLTQQKNELRHGEWTQWATDLPFDLRTAQRYMKAYANRDRIKNDNVSCLSAAYRLLEQSHEKPTAETGKAPFVADYIEAVKHLIDEIELAIAGAMRGKFDPASKNFVKTKHDKIRELQSKLERIM